MKNKNAFELLTIILNYNLIFILYRRKGLIFQACVLLMVILILSLALS